MRKDIDSPGEIISVIILSSLLKSHVLSSVCPLLSVGAIMTV